MAVRPSRPALVMEKAARASPPASEATAPAEAPASRTGRSRGRAPAKTPRSPSRIGKRAAVAWLEPEAVKQLGIMAIQEERTVQDLLAEAVDLLFANRGKNRLARAR